ncbi:MULTISPECIES: hypothetical protein [Chryseobacterium]|uniref:Uncharacterized protein n=2 Tax=Chryseobacterium gleum TaxID=250 RepID=A0A448B9N5_CHRGE|nr:MULTISPECIES: hypothetical protein [Chryseobacterium]EFK36043.1 hypothetical protein HMPREF0204_15112 [Chryseobacterium gleum ATCC 35910]QQY31747.1 hypothetical protein I6I60_23355 [Chryseobacterium gleum]VEE11241.1 Uncharacterised protein [Chryseobacterium gleum]VFA44030.1 Uncharacterised protein [Chryseobacterium indologenes]
MEIFYSISIDVSISDVEAGLLHKYLKMHPKERLYIGEGHFAFYFNEFEQNKEFELTLNTAIIDSCVTVLEDQDLGDPLENLLKRNLLEKIYKWSDIIDNEQKAIDELENDFYMNCTEEFYKADIGFSFENYLKLHKQASHVQILIKQKASLLEKVMRFFKL